MRYFTMQAGAFVVAGTILVSSLCTIAPAAERPQVFDDKHDAGYQPRMTYAGEFIPTRLYYRNPRSALWMDTGFPDNYKEQVSCPVALSSLEYTGSWQGHLNGDGSCGPVEEPSFFALGNRINYDVLLDQDVSSQ